jgi:hypothetical protein
MEFRDALENFGDLLDTRLGSGVFTTEDSVRYTLFAALLTKWNLRPEEIVLEQPHPAIARAQIDAWIPAAGDRPGVAIEFKYDREMPSERNSPRTQKAGKVFHDLYRLGTLPKSVVRIFVYLTSSEMAGYFRNPSNGLSAFFALPLGRSLPIDAGFMQGRASTFVQSAGQVPSVAVRTLHSRSLSNNHELRVFEVQDIEQHDES